MYTYVRYACVICNHMQLSYIIGIKKKKKKKEEDMTFILSVFLATLNSVLQLIQFLVRGDT